ncbi:MAG: NAD-dependent epimerase/dehydratase family protein [Bacteroidetes bacterium]|nr:MAG: NAD-dependent epimerase/dehydratase family protein [Bacteroidota bacterium]
MSAHGFSLVTGGLGFIGRHLVEALIKRGKQVRVLDINPNTRQFHGEVDIYKGSILDRNIIEQVLEGVTDVYHLAAIPHLWSLNTNDFFEVNFKGTEILLNEAKKFPINRFVYTSSEAVLSGWRHKSIEPIDETQPLPLPEELPGPYSRSKLLAEKAVHKAVQEGLPAVIVYPTIPIGAGDVNLTPPTRMIKDFLNGKTLAYLECNLNLIPVKAVAEGHILAAEMGSVGERYILGQDNMKMSELLLMIEQQLGRKMPKRKVPYSVAILAARVMELMAKLNHKMPPASVEGVRLAGTNMVFDCSKARKELALSQYSTPQALLEAAGWLEEHGHLD